MKLVCTMTLRIKHTSSHILLILHKYTLWIRPVTLSLSLQTVLETLLMWYYSVFISEIDEIEQHCKVDSHAAVCSSISISPKMSIISLKSSFQKSPAAAEECGWSFRWGHECLDFSLSVFWLSWSSSQRDSLWTDTWGNIWPLHEKRGSFLIWGTADDGCTDIDKV